MFSVNDSRLVLEIFFHSCVVHFLNYMNKLNKGPNHVKSELQQKIVLKNKNYKKVLQKNAFLNKKITEVNNFVQKNKNSFQK